MLRARYTSRRLMSNRRTYGRRTGRYYGRRRQGFLSTGRTGKSHFSSCLAVYNNPFSTATTNPKIPDGKVYASTGIRLQAVEEVQNDASENMDILLFPGLSNGLIVSSTNKGTPAGDPYSIPYRDHGRTQAGPSYAQVSAPIHKWRLVSQALKITLVNNSDENDGWFEAIRIQGSSDSGFASTIRSGETTAIIGAGGAPVLPAITSTNLVEHPTYVTGKLRDIHRYMFHLMPQGNDHEFQIIPREPANATEFVHSQLDNESFDMVFIRIHGRTGAAPTRLMVHVVSNQEVVYDESSFMTRYHSEARGNNLAFQANKKRKMEMPANTTAALIPMARLQQARWG